MSLVSVGTQFCPFQTNLCSVLPPRQQFVASRTVIHRWDPWDAEVGYKMRSGSYLSVTLGEATYCGWSGKIEDKLV